MGAQEIENLRHNEHQNESSASLHASQNAGAELADTNSIDSLSNSPNSETEVATSSSEGLKTTTSEPCRHPKESFSNTNNIADCNKEELSEAKAGISCTVTNKEKC